MTRITIGQLKAISDLLLSHLEKNGVNEVDVAADFYWDIPASKRYDQYKEPKEHTVGQLSDDISELRRILDGGAPPVGYGLVWLSTVLRRIGETSIG